jgi:hypothetical protein
MKVSGNGFFHCSFVCLNFFQAKQHLTKHFTEGTDEMTKISLPVSHLKYIALFSFQASPSQHEVLFLQ